MFPTCAIIQKSGKNKRQLFPKDNWEEWINDGGLNGLKVPYSLNKDKRWELPDAIQEEILRESDLEELRKNRQYRRKRKKRADDSSESGITCRARTVLVERNCSGQSGEFIRATEGRNVRSRETFVQKIVDSESFSKRESKNW